MVILIRYGEIHLKGLNRPVFEQRLKNNIKAALYAHPGIQLKRVNGRFILFGFLSDEGQAILDKLTRVFGIHSVSLAIECDKDFTILCETALASFQQALELDGGKTFKVESKRADKGYFLDSMGISREVGGYLFEHTGVEVDVHHPDVTVYVEIREKAYVYSRIIPGAGGLPVGCNGKAGLLISGGIDSPVAGYMTMKRGVALECIHFFSFPYTGELAKQKVIDLCKILCRYGGSIKVHIVPFTEIQTQIFEKCPNAELTVLMRRMMMRIADRIARENDCKALITGEAIGQVASQTLDSLGCTDAVTQLPVLRPVIGFDKEEIVTVAKKIGTFDTSILPYEDCCTVFTPKRPVTAPKIGQMEKSEQLLEVDRLVEEAIAQTEMVIASNRMKEEYC